MEEEKKEEKEISPRPSEEQNQGEKPETPDYKVELSEMERRIGEKIEKKLSEVHFKLRQVAKGEYVDENDKPQALSEDQIRGVIAEVVREETKKIGESLNLQVSELVKSFASKQSKSLGGGEGGQKPPVVERSTRPELTPDEEETVKGLDWDGEKNGWTDPQTKQFFPHERKTTSPKE